MKKLPLMTALLVSATYACKEAPPQSSLQQSTQAINPQLDVHAAPTSPKTAVKHAKLEKTPPNYYFTSPQKTAIKELQDFQKSTQQSVATTFDFKAWQENEGKHVALKKWSGYNPTPWRGYYGEDSQKCAKTWYLSLGPLGITTLMHDRSWPFKSVVDIMPKHLADGNKLIFNCFEVHNIKPGSPSSGKLQKGDLILAMDNQPLRTAQNFYLGTPMDLKTIRGLEIHAGQLLDKAEGRGSISLAVLRLDEGQKKKFANVLKNKIKWLKTTQKQEKSFSVSLPADCQQVKVQVGRGQTLVSLEVSGQGKRFPLENSNQRRGSLKGYPLEVPVDGQWTLHVNLQSSKGAQNVTIETAGKTPFPAELRPFLKTLTIPLQKIGSFGSSFDPNSAKVETYSRMLAHRLATQQAPDGSWNAGGYASASFHSSICGLALMSTENPIYDNHIRKAAHYVAYKGNYDKWTYSQGAWVLFLSEYYLRTKDKSILPGLRNHVKQGRRFVLNDYTAGHSMYRPGYGGSGYIGGGGMLALGFAAASHTPAMDSEDKLVLDRMLKRIQEIAPHGKVPYGRGGKKLETDPAPGQSGSCGTGPYFLASLIRGGVHHFTKTCAQRYSSGHYGSAEGGHATQTIHFSWAMLSSAAVSDKAYRESMNAYLWKFTTLREYDGFVNHNNYRCEYHNGDGAIGAPYWRTAGYLLIMNARKRNLAITGHPAYRQASFAESKVTFHRDSAAKNYLLRNWALTAETLGAKAPQSFKKAHKLLTSLPADRQLGAKINSLFLGDIGTAVDDILKAPRFSTDISNAQIVELMLGLGFKASCYAGLEKGEADTSDQAKDKKSRKKAAKAESKQVKKMLASGQNVKLPHTLSLSPTSIHNVVAKLNESLPLEIKNLRLTVSDSSKKYLKKPLTLLTDNWKCGSDTKSLTSKFDCFTQSTDKLDVSISYEVLGRKIAYKCKMDLPAKTTRGYTPMLTRPKVRGRLALDYSRQCALPVQLKNTGLSVGCETPNNMELIDFIPAGAELELRITPFNIWGHCITDVKILNWGNRQVHAKSGKEISPALLKDLEKGSGEVYKLSAKSQTLEFALPANSKLNAFYMNIPLHWRKDRNFVVEVLSEGQWKIALSSEKPGLHPLAPYTASALRIRFAAGPASEITHLCFLREADIPSEAAKSRW